MTSGEAESHDGILGGWSAGLPSPSMEEDFYPFLMERRPSSYLGPEMEEEEEGSGQEDLSLALERKEKDLLLAAELGKALLERNDFLERGREALEEELRETRERLEQEKHALRLRLEVRESEWRAQVTDLESDLREAQLQLRQAISDQRESGRETSSTVQQLSEQNQRLLEQLAQASELEQSLTLQLQSLRDQNRDLALTQGHLAPALQSLHSENTLLLEQKREMESRMRVMREEQENTQNLLYTLKESALQLERQRSQAEERLQEAQMTVQQLRDSQHSLQSQVRELQDELKMRDSHLLQDSRPSLQREMQESASAQQNGMAPPSMLGGASDSSYLEQRQSDLLQEKEGEVSRLQDQVAMQHVELSSLRQELQRLQEIVQNGDSESLLRQAITDRDDAIIKKGELELELAKCRLEKDSMSRQLLSAVEQKVLLSQELEAWQDDMQIVISQQLKSQREQEVQRSPDSAPATPTRRESFRRARDSKIFSFFKKI